MHLQDSNIGAAPAPESGASLGRIGRGATVLDTLTKFAATISGGHAWSELGETERIRAGRWLALYDVRDALAGQVDRKGEPFRTVQCMRHLLPDADYVDVVRSESRQKARYGSQMRVCGSVWSCPICSSNIAEGRRDQVERALKVARSRGYSVLMVTRTVRHSSRWSLEWQLERFSASERAMTAHRGYKALLARLGCVGTLRVLEVTWGAQSGWHVHTHSLMFLQHDAGDLAVVKSELFACWRAAAASHKLATSPDAFTVQATWGAVDEYVAKWGREPIRRPWGVEDELTKAGVKVARRGDRYSPFALASDHPDKFVEYCRAFKGKQQMRWSPGLFAHLLPDELERSDLELAETPARDYEAWAVLFKPELRAVDYARAHHLLLTLAGRGDRLAFVALVGKLRNRYSWLSSDHDVGGWELPAPAPAEVVDGLPF